MSTREKRLREERYGGTWPGASARPSGCTAPGPKAHQEFRLPRPSGTDSIRPKSGSQILFPPAAPQLMVPISRLVLFLIEFFSFGFCGRAAQEVLGATRGGSGQPCSSSSAPPLSKKKR